MSAPTCHFQKNSNSFLEKNLKIVQNFNRLDEMILNIYICRGIVGDTSFINFQQFSLIFRLISTISWGINRFDWMISKKIYILGSNPDFSFAHLNGAKLGEAGGGGIHKVTYMTDHKSLFIFRKASHDNTLSRPLLRAILRVPPPLF